MLMLYLRLAYCIPSICLYCVIVVLIYKEKQRLFGSFYSLWNIQAMTNMLVFLNAFYVIELSNETDQNSWWSFIYKDAPEVVVRISTCLALHFAFVQTFLTFLISLNRMSVMVWPNLDEWVWNAAVPLGAIVAYLSPFIVTHPYLTHHTSFIYSPVAKCYIAITEADWPTIWRQLFAFMCVFVVVSAAVNTVSVIRLCQRPQRMRCVRVERNMLMLAFLNFLIEVSYFVLVAIIHISQNEDFNNIISLSLIPYASDVVTLSAPYLIVFLNRNIRTRLHQILRCGRKQPQCSANARMEALVPTSSVISSVT